MDIATDRLLYDVMLMVFITFIVLLIEIQARIFWLGSKIYYRVFYSCAERRGYSSYTLSTTSKNNDKQGRKITRAGYQRLDDTDVDFDDDFESSYSKSHSIPLRMH